jgi:hypothetical protein
VIWILALAFPCGIAAQSGDADYVRLPEAKEIALARSAAPEAVSADATVWVLRDGAFQVAVHGGNGNHCFVQRSQPLSLEPICYDPEGAETIMRWEFEHFRGRTAGSSREELERALAEAVGSGEIAVPKRPAMSYMMSSAQRLYDPESGRSAGNWMPHIMLYVPYLTSEAIGLEQMMPTIQVTEGGTPMAHLIVVVPEFVDPKTP